MTDTSSVAITHSTTESYPVAAPLDSPSLNGAIAPSVVAEDEEPYTIKCICAYEDDDGNTVFCEGCETWQHIECYYHPDNVVPEVHNCVDCEPRFLDWRRATERQRKRREQSDSGDRKPRRQGAKGQKKKSKEHHDSHVNGTHRRSDSSSRDHHPTKKAKTTHRASQSIGSLPNPPLLGSDGKRRGGCVTTMATSPTKPSGPVIPLYSEEFLHLYERDQGHTDMDSNLFVKLPLATDLASWVTDPAALSRVTNGRRPASDIFTWSGATLDTSRWPSLSTESIIDHSIEVDGRHPSWKILKTLDPVQKNNIIGEIKGKIGSLRDYCLDPYNRWQDLRHPEPFVFFHPQLPIYIDSRQEGSLLRYIRRSCRPNVTMKTYITNEVEYHFCFVAREDIPANSEITAMWYLDPQLFESSNGIVKSESSDAAQEEAAFRLSNVLSHFGGCACDPQQSCLLSNVDRRRHPKAQESGSASKQINGKRKKTKAKNNRSPPATGYPSNSRAGSETTRNPDDDDAADNRSSSGSVRGQTRSRDLTPTLLNTHDLFGDSELSARDKRKIAAVEKKFQQLEQDQQASHRRKKRSSGPSAHPTPSISTAAQPSYFGTNADNKSRRSPSSELSPGSLHAAGPATSKVSGLNTPITQSPSKRADYVECAVQVDLDLDEATSMATHSPIRRTAFVPLTQRLLKRCHEDRVRLEAQLRQIAPPGTPHSYGATLSGSQASTSDEVDADEMDVDTPSPKGFGIQHDAGLPSTGTAGAFKPPFQLPWPPTAAHNLRIPTEAANDVRNDSGQMTVTSTHPPATPSAPLPSPLIESQWTSHMGSVGVTAPSPVKKKLSLGDYLIRRGTLAAPASEKSQTHAVPALFPQNSSVDQSQAEHSAKSSADGARIQPNGVLDGGPPQARSVHDSDLPMRGVPEGVRDVPEAVITPQVSSVS